MTHAPKIPHVSEAKEEGKDEDVFHFVYLGDTQNAQGTTLLLSCSTLFSTEGFAQTYSSVLLQLFML